MFKKQNLKHISGFYLQCKISCLVAVSKKVEFKYSFGTLNQLGCVYRIRSLELILSVTELFTEVHTLSVMCALISLQFELDWVGLYVEGKFHQSFTNLLHNLMVETESKPSREVRCKMGHCRETYRRNVTDLFYQLFKITSESA